MAGRTHHDRGKTRHRHTSHRISDSGLLNRREKNPRVSTEAQTAMAKQPGAGNAHVPWRDTASGGPRQGEEEELGFRRWKDTQPRSKRRQALIESFAHGQILFSKRYDPDRTDREKPQPPGLQQQV